MVHFSRGPRLVCLLQGVLVAIGSDAPVIAQDYDQKNRAETLARDVSYSEPPTYAAGAAGTRLVLDVAECVNTLDGRRLKHRSYNNGLVGPVIRVRRGTSLNVRLENRLPAGPPDGHQPNEPHGYNTTNLHTHGLHVSPVRPSDDVFLEVPPDAHFDFQFDIAPDHPAGTFWYHAHKHGSTALQLASGMAGALIVEGGLDEVPEIRAAEEKILVLQQFVLREVPGEPWIVHPDDVYKGDGERVDTVNGVKTPTMTMRPGEVQRWRIIHAGIGDSMSLRLDGLSMHEIAVDGLATGTMEPVDPDGLELHPGQRSDVLVKAPRIDEEQASYVLSTEVANPRENIRNRIVVTTDLLKVVVSGAPQDMPLPEVAALQPYAAFPESAVPEDDEISATWTLRFQDASTGEERRFLINDSAYTGEVERRIPLGTAEEWTIESVVGSHPFHVHVNPFAVRETDGDGNVTWRWRDTLFVPHEETRVIRAWFREHTGQTVLHCHILDHEDLGMMQAIEFVEALGQSCREREGLPPGGTASPDWSLRSPAGAQFGSAVLRGRSALLVFHRGLGCEHCSQQLVLLARQQREIEFAGAQLAAISPRLPAPMQLAVQVGRLGLDFPLLADPELDVFREYGCLSDDGTVLHGLVLIDPAGAVLWSTAGEEPLLDMEQLLEIVREELGQGAADDTSAAEVNIPLTDREVSP